MGLRFRKSFKIAPGVKFNLNKKNSSITFGGKESITQLVRQENRNNKGCLFWILAFFAFCFALTLYSFMWVLGIIAIIFFAVKKGVHQQKRNE